MSLDRVTITGADDSTRPEDLVALSEEFPFVEWGILLSAKQVGSPRFPSLDWLRGLLAVVPDHMMFSAHLCGKYVRQVCQGDWGWTEELAHARITPILFRRVQLNFHAYTHLLNEDFVPSALVESVVFQLIFQCDGVNDHLVSSAYDDGLDAVPLYDRSGGAGIVPGSWPGSMKGIYSGYAGGLGPDNLEEEIPKIAEAAGGERHWIDMETRVRSDDDRLFDLSKIRQCLELAAPFIAVSV